MRNGTLAIRANAGWLPLLCLCFAATAAAQDKARAGDAGADAQEREPVVQVELVEPPEPGSVPGPGAPQPPIEVQRPTGFRAIAPPEFPGGEASLRAYLRDNLQYPSQARKAQTQGVVVVRFDVDVDGTLKNINLLRDIGGGCGAEAERLVRNMPPWRPAQDSGTPVKQEYTLRIDFELAQWLQDRKARK
ncbi:TonB family protein [Lysobacter enzymogenes]|uniref:TonB family protein n=1 Tax=Lysobacter enzymogenes TaxID=69 RepID=A0AAU9ASX0_LYSEN|nr:TonB family protein [Lysobacter enzymogenes]BAV98300.1 TonB family protein [Lysobacter enzymogenes]